MPSQPGRSRPEWLNRPLAGENCQAFSKLQSAMKLWREGGPGAEPGSRARPTASALPSRGRAETQQAAGVLRAVEEDQEEDSPGYSHLLCR